MSDAKTPSPSSSAVLPGSERPDYRGKCLYKTGKCLNERALKTSGAAHNLCDEHRNRQNQHQRKLDAKHRLTKRERRVAAKPTPTSKQERFAPYPVQTGSNTSAKNVAAVKGKEVIETELAVVPLQTPLTSAGLLGLAASVSTRQTAAPQVLASASSGLVYVPPQPPQLPYPFSMQDFDGLVVPLPSCFEGQERVEFRQRVYQKVLDFISEECVLRFGAKVEQPVAAAKTEAKQATSEVDTAMESDIHQETETKASTETHNARPS